MQNLISRQAAIDALAEHEKSRGHNYTLFVDIVSECAEIIRDLPSAQPERQAGKWQMVYHNDYRTVGHIECDQCGYHTKGHMKYNFCPNCGADMRGEQDG